MDFSSKLFFGIRDCLEKTANLFLLFEEGNKFAMIDYPKYTLLVNALLDGEITEKSGTSTFALTRVEADD